MYFHPTTEPPPSADEHRLHRSPAARCFDIPTEQPAPPAPAQGPAAVEDVARQQVHVFFHWPHWLPKTQQPPYDPAIPHFNDYPCTPPVWVVEADPSYLFEGASETSTPLADTFDHSRGEPVTRGEPDDTPCPGEEPSPLIGSSSPLPSPSTDLPSLPSFAELLAGLGDALDLEEPYGLPIGSRMHRASPHPASHADYAYPFGSTVGAPLRPVIVPNIPSTSSRPLTPPRERNASETRSVSPTIEDIRAARRACAAPGACDACRIKKTKCKVREGKQTCEECSTKRSEPCTWNIPHKRRKHCGCPSCGSWESRP